MIDSGTDFNVDFSDEQKEQTVKEKKKTIRFSIYNEEFKILLGLLNKRKEKVFNYTLSNLIEEGLDIVCEKYDLDLNISKVSIRSGKRWNVEPKKVYQSTVYLNKTYENILNAFIHKRIIADGNLEYRRADIFSDILKELLSNKKNGR